MPDTSKPTGGNDAVPKAGGKANQGSNSSGGGDKAGSKGDSKLRSKF